MKFVNYLEKISHISIYGLTSFMIFFIFFCAVFIWVLKSDKNEMKKISRIPLD
ncbi:MAG: CcoQ/FixQ family Cbb3-type cytochrome c oxidase assembly chaperone [Chitinophagaceae bacterium]|nr:CcoQ/FixQ family Cbb3-type cytochrome c oxidase assembly chaperone [Chitinophagaceae bacterium]